MGHAVPPDAGREPATTSDAALLLPALLPLVRVWTEGAASAAALPGADTAAVAAVPGVDIGAPLPVAGPKWKGQALPVPGLDASAPGVKMLRRLPATPSWAGTAADPTPAGKFNFFSV